MGHVPLKRSFAVVGALLANVAFALGSPTAQGASPLVAKKVAEFRERIWVGGADFNQDATELAINALSTGPDVHIWDWRNERIARVLPMGISSGDGRIRYSPNGALLVAGHDLGAQRIGSGLIRIWDAHTGEVVHDVAEPGGATNVMDFSFSPDGRFFVRSVQRGARYFLVVHQTDSWSEVWSLETGMFRPRVLALSPEFHSAAMGGETCEANPQMICHPQVLIIDLEKRQITRTIGGAFPDQNQIRALAWSPDGRSLAAGVIVQGTYPGPYAVKIFDPMTGAESASETAKVADVNAIRYSPNGLYLVETSLDEHVCIWDGQHKQLLQTIRTSTGSHTTLAVSRDSRYLMIGAGPDVSVWELK